VTRVALRIAVVAVLALPVTLGAAQPSDASRAPRTVTLSAPSTALTGSRVHFSGRVKNAHRGTAVKIQLRTGTTWHTRATTTTRAGGRFAVSLIVRGPGSATYRAYTRRKHARPRSATIHLAVLRRESVQVHANRTNAEPGTPVALSISTNPAQPGRTVQLQTRTGSAAWRVAGTSTLSRAGAGTFHVQPTTTGTVQYRALTSRHGYDAPAASAAIAVLVQPKGARFGQLMTPESTQVVAPSVATWSFHAKRPSWWSHHAEVRWDTPGAFTPSLTPEASNAYTGHPDPTLGAEFNNGNSSLQTADVSFEATGTTFAIQYLSYSAGSAMIWIDGHPISSTPVAGVAPAKGGQLNWIQVTLAHRRTVHVRFAGPDHFVGVDHDAKVPLTVRAAPYAFTLGVVSDSYFDASIPYRTYEGSGAAVLHTRTGFRVWDLAQGGTGYLNDGTGSANTGDAGYPGRYASPFGSEARMARLKNAPIDALLVNGSVNDGGADNAVYTAAVNHFLDRVAELRPGLPVVILGIEPTTVIADAGWRIDLDAKNQLLEEIAAQHTNVVGFINPYDEHWLTGTGSTTEPEGDGNQDLYIAPDHIHLSPAGQAYYQDLVADRLAPLHATLGTP
jgi:lysophospholipase L1-like esterase